jgi:hypothetical protein
VTRPALGSARPNLAPAEGIRPGLGQRALNRLRLAPRARTHPADPRAESHPAADPRAGTRPAADHPADTHPAADPHAESHPAADPHAGTHPAADPHGETHPAADHPAGTHPAADPHAGTHPAADPPGETRPAADHPAGTRPAADRPADTRPAADPHAGTHPAADPPGETHPAADHPADTHPAADQTFAARRAQSQRDRVPSPVAGAGRDALPGASDQRRSRTRIPRRSVLTWRSRIAGKPRAQRPDPHAPRQQGPGQPTQLTDPAAGCASRTRHRSPCAPSSDPRGTSACQPLLLPGPDGPR